MVSGRGRARVHLERRLERPERAELVSLGEADEPEAREGAEVAGLEGESALHVLHRGVELAREIVGGGAFVPALGELGCEVDDLPERRDRLAKTPRAHLLDARLHEAVHFLAAALVPDHPDVPLGMSDPVRSGRALQHLEQGREAGIGLIRRAGGRKHEERERRRPSDVWLPVT